MFANGTERGNAERGPRRADRVGHRRIAVNTPAARMEVVAKQMHAVIDDEADADAKQHHHKGIYLAHRNCPDTKHNRCGK